MIRISSYLLLFGSLTLCSCSVFDTPKHLFILSGQSNMALIPLQKSFKPIIEKEYGNEHVLIVKDAVNGQPISKWYQHISSFDDKEQSKQPDLYDYMLANIKAISHEYKIGTVTFIWMQGEADALMGTGDVYEESLYGLYDQLCDDLNRNDINFVIGRINDHDLKNERFVHWTMIRDIQVKVAESNHRFDWVNTDDLNDGYNNKGELIENDLHMSELGYVILGRRFAQKSIELIKKNP